ncbi:GPI inositol-deacylase [Streptomyces sp. NBC_01622]|uniref:PGAP1-like alpha/beta domain-containing protein n=1 Tax=Streptomyces sp. NBC_01622 TaxID=2975903 RepID=UPI00386BB3C0|nr:GPI inositol-deacylase [Streptomyces sp. NBC_01622]
MGAKVVVVHGVGQEYAGSNSLQAGVAAAVRDGLCHARGPDVDPSEVAVAFYGNVFRFTPGEGTKGGQDAYTFRDISSGPEAEMLTALWDGTRADGAWSLTAGPANSKAATPRTVQQALNALSRSPFLARAGQRFLIGVLKQVTRYLTEEETRRRVQAEIAAVIGPQTRVVVGHSLGSVVAYEALCVRRPDWSVRTLVTIGSPLGIPQVVFDRLNPMPVNGRGQWPGGVSRWTNLCDERDVVALVKRLEPLFGDGSSRIRDVLIHNGWQAHAIQHHLTAKETGKAIADGLSG